MELEKLSNGQLLENTKRIVSEEKRITNEIIAHFAEVERRRLHLELGYSSMFSYATSELRYSEDEAYRRISAARLLREIPEITPQIEKGELSVTALCQAQRVFKKEKYTTNEKKELLGTLVGKSKRETEKILAHVSPEPKRMNTIEVDDETLELLKRIRDLQAHKLTSGYNDLLKQVAREHLKRIDHREKPTRTLKTPCPGKVSSTRYIPRSVMQTVWKRDEGKCTYKHQNKRCESTYKLQLDHIIPYALGGRSDDPHNLRLLCASHNAFYAVKTYGRAKMGRYLRV